MRLPTLLYSLLISLIPTGEAATVFRCTAPDGNVLFSQHGCPTERLQKMQEANNPEPGGDERVPMASTKTSAPRGAARSKEGVRDAVVVVGERQNGCGNRVTGTARRKAIIEGRVRTGMTRSDVESALGRPDRISQQNEKLRYYYQADKKHGARTVTFDEDGCVTGKAKR